MADPNASSAAAPRKRADRVLVVAIVVMGVLLIGGVLTVLGTIGYRLAGRSAVVRSPMSTLTVEGSLRTLALDGERLALGLLTPDGEIVVIYDLATGREVGRLTLQPPRP